MFKYDKSNRLIQVNCKTCKEPIRGHSTFEEAVIKGVAPKELKSCCGESFPYCMECYLKSKKDVVCENQHCIKMKEGKCLYLVVKVIDDEKRKKD